MKLILKNDTVKHTFHLRDDLTTKEYLEIITSMIRNYKLAKEHQRD